MSETSDIDVKTRLIRAAEAEIVEHGIDGIQMGSIASRAGVSRATAFRQLGSVSEALYQVSLLRAQHHGAIVSRLMESRSGTLAKLEEALVYSAAELNKDPSIAVQIARRADSRHDARIHEASVSVLAPVLEEGQRSGEIRTDLSIIELADYFVEQTYLAADEPDRSEAAARKRFRYFVAPVLESRNGFGGGFLSGAREVDGAIAAAMEALTKLRLELRRHTT